MAAKKRFCGQARTMFTDWWSNVGDCDVTYDLIEEYHKDGKMFAILTSAQGFDEGEGWYDPIFFLIGTNGEEFELADCTSKEQAKERANAIVGGF